MQELTLNDFNSERHDVFLRQFSANEPGLRAFVRSLLPTREDAREVMQDLAVVLWKKFAELPSDDDFRRWAFGVARVEVLTYVRDKARDRHRFSEEIMQSLAEASSARCERQDDRREALEVCLQKLPQSQRELVLAAYAPQAKIGELAERRGQTAMSLYKVLHRLRVSLLDCVRHQLASEGLA